MPPILVNVCVCVCVIQLPLGCLLTQADWQGFKSEAEAEITQGDVR